MDAKINKQKYGEKQDADTTPMYLSLYYQTKGKTVTLQYRKLILL